MEESARTFSSSLLLLRLRETCSKLAKEVVRILVRIYRRDRWSNFVRRNSLHVRRFRIISSRGPDQRIKFIIRVSFANLADIQPREGNKESGLGIVFSLSSLLFFEISPPPPPPPLSRIFSRIHEILPSRCYFEPFFPPHPFPFHLFAARSHRAKAHRWTKIRGIEKIYEGREMVVDWIAIAVEKEEEERKKGGGGKEGRRFVCGRKVGRRNQLLIQSRPFVSREET